MGSAVAKSRLKVFVEVLQNGEFLAEASRPFGKRARIAITTSSRGSLQLPFYPLANDIELLRLDRRGAHLTLEPAWEGFVTCDGSLVNVQPGRRHTKTYIMREGDYASLIFNDLRVLIRIGRERVTSRLVRLDPAYRGKFMKIWVPDATHAKTLAIGATCAAILLGGFVVGLLGRPDDRPRSMAELPPQYTLPFIHPKHLEYLPEALQQNLNRRQPLVSALDYFNRLTSTILGYDTSENRFVFALSSQRYRDLYRESTAEIAAKREAQLEREDALFSKPGNAIVTIPSVEGESFLGSVARLHDKMAILHESLEQNLDLRREMTKAYRGDPEYDYNEYRNLQTDREMKEKLEKIKVWDRPTDEEAMYREAKALADVAARQQQRIRQTREPIVTVTPENALPIAIPADVDFASFVHNNQLLGLNDKLAYINASEYGRKAPAKIKEPLIGEIDPSLIEKTIAKKKFELQLCFELALRRNQLAGGTMEWQWRLDSRGVLSELNLVQSTIRDQQMIRCVRQKIASWRFPRPRRGSIEVRYPFSFARIRG